MRKFVKTLPLNVNNHQPVSLNAVCFDSESYNHQSNFYEFVSTKHESTSNFRLPSKRGFKIASLNVNSLSAHIDEVRILLDDKFLDVLAIQETQLNNSHRDSEFYIPVLIQLDAIESVMAVVVFISISNLASIFLFETILTFSRSRKCMYRSSKTPIQASYCGQLVSATKFPCQIVFTP